MSMTLWEKCGAKVEAELCQYEPHPTSVRSPLLPMDTRQIRGTTHHVSHSDSVARVGSKRNRDVIRSLIRENPSALGPNWLARLSEVQASERKPGQNSIVVSSWPCRGVVTYAAMTEFVYTVNRCQRVGDRDQYPNGTLRDYHVHSHII